MHLHMKAFIWSLEGCGMAAQTSAVDPYVRWLRCAASSPWTPPPRRRTTRQAGMPFMQLCCARGIGAFALE